MHYVWTAAEMRAIAETCDRILAYEEWLIGQRSFREESRITFPYPAAERTIDAACPDWKRATAMCEEALRQAQLVRGGKPSYLSRQRLDDYKAAHPRPNGHGMRKKKDAA